MEKIVDLQLRDNYNTACKDIVYSVKIIEAQVLSMMGVTCQLILFMFNSYIIY